MVILSEAFIYVAWTNKTNFPLSILGGSVTLASRCGDPTLHVIETWRYLRVTWSQFSEGHMTSMEIGSYAGDRKTPFSASQIALDCISSRHSQSNVRTWSNSSRGLSSIEFGNWAKSNTELWVSLISEPIKLNRTEPN